MKIGQRLRNLREARNLSQGDIEKRTGLMPCYISVVENSHTIPTIETLEKFARALEVPIYKLFYEGSESPRKLAHAGIAEPLWGTNSNEWADLRALATAITHMSERDRTVLLALAKRVAKRRRRSKSNSAEESL